MAYADEVLLDTPLLYYKLDDAAGTTVVDASGNAHNAVYQGSAGTSYTLLQTAIANTSVNSVRFNNGASNGAALLNPVPGTFPTNAITIEFWQENFTKANPFAQVWNHWEAGGNRSGIRINDVSSKYELFISLGGSGALVEFSGGPSAIVPDKRHVVITWRNSDGRAQLWINGTLEDTQTVATGVTMNATGSMVFGAGQSAVATIVTTQAPSVRMDEAAVYTSVLSDARIAAHWAAGEPPPQSFYCIQPPEIVIPQPPPTLTGLSPINGGAVINNPVPSAATTVSFTINEPLGTANLDPVILWVDMGGVTEVVYSSEDGTSLKPGWNGTVTQNTNTLVFIGLYPTKHWREDGSNEVTFFLEAYNGFDKLSETWQYLVSPSAVSAPTISVDTASPIAVDDTISVTITDALEAGVTIITAVFDNREEVIYHELLGNDNSPYTVSVVDTTTSKVYTITNVDNWGGDFTLKVVTQDPDTCELVTATKAFQVEGLLYPPNMDPFY